MYDKETKTNRENFNSFVEHLEHLKKCEDLLEKVWFEMGPYTNKPLSHELTMKLQDHFNFDDGE